MSVKERILALKLMEKAQSNPQISRDLGIRLKMVERTKNYNQIGNQKNVYTTNNKGGIKLWHTD